MTYPVVEYVNAPAGTTDFDVPFPFLSVRHVEVLVNDAEAFILEWIGERRIKLSAPVQPSDIVTIQRNTPIETALVQFQNGAVLTQEDLNTAVTQLLFKQQELQALYDATLKRARIRLGEANGILTNPEEVVQELANLVLEDEVLAMFRQRISDIDMTASQVVDVVIGSAQMKDTLGNLAKDLTEVQKVVDSLADLEGGSGIATRIEEVRQQAISGDTALAALVRLIGAKSGTSNAFLLDLDNVRVSPSESLAQRLTSIKSATDDLGAAIQREQTTRTDAISAEATARETLAATLRKDFAATVQSETTARVNQDNVFAGLFTLLGAQSPDKRAFILNDNAVQLSNGQSLATRLSGLDTSLGGLSASIANVDKARVTDNSALSESIGLVRTDVGKLSSSVGILAQSVDGVKARYGVSLDVNGYVTGFVQNNDGRTGSFVILADRFAIVDPNGGRPTVPFEVSQGEVWVNGQRIRPGSIDADRLRVSHLSALTADIGFLVSYNGQGGRVERDGNGTRIYGNNGVLRVKMGF